MTLQPGVAKEEKPSLAVAMHEGLNGISYTHSHTLTLTVGTNTKLKHKV